MIRAVLRTRSMALAAAFALLAARAGAQAAHDVTYEVDPLSSIAWWQVVPHLNRLWATTCPEERSWLPPAGHDAGSEDASSVGKPTWKQLDTNLVPIPLLPRYRVRPVCSAKAIHGELIVPDTTTWTGAHGQVAVDGAALTQGGTLDDNYAHGVVMNVALYPQIVFRIDSVVSVTTSDDTVHALAVGAFTLRGVTTPLRVPVTVWHEAGGMRVKGRWSILAHDLVEVYHFSPMALGFGVGTYIWRLFFMGIDLVIRPGVSTP